MKLIEITCYGRGGQGAKTLAFLFAQIAFENGWYAQAFPEYGPERMGAPVHAFVRLSDRPIDLHCAVETPDIYVVLDATLPLDDVSRTKLLINTDAEFGRPACIVPASSIAQEIFHKNIPNMPMLGALMKVMKIPLETEKIRAKLTAKFGGRADLIKGNLECVKRGYAAVK